MNTAFMLLALYDGKPVIPVADVCRDFFGGLTPEKFLRKTVSGDIPLPILRMEASQKAAKGVHINDLAAFLDVRRDAAQKELASVNR